MFSISFENGIVTYRGTAGSDVFSIGRDDGNPHGLIWFKDHDASITLKESDVRGVVAYGGDGHDFLGFSARTGIDIPMTLLGGAGDDTLLGSAASDMLVGGQGEDLIDAESTVPDWESFWELERRATRVGDDLILASGAGDVLQGDGEMGSDFHGDDVLRYTVTFHQGIVRITAGPNVASIALMTWPDELYALAVGSDGRTYWSGVIGRCLGDPSTLPRLIEVYIGDHVDYRQFDQFAASLGIEVKYIRLEDGARPGAPEQTTPSETQSPSSPAAISPASNLEPWSPEDDPTADVSPWDDDTE